MKNTVICENCSSKNEYFRYKCKNCGSFLRTKVANIDLGHMLWQIIEDPAKAFKTIVHSEHKNYFVIVLLLALLKIFLFRFSAIIISERATEETTFLVELSIFAGFFIAFLLLLTIGTRIVLKSFKYNTRFWDVFATNIYSLIPFSFSLIFISTIQYALFGKYWFVFNPSPFFIKPVPAYILAGIEFLTLVWSMSLFYVSMKVHTKSRIISTIYMIVTILFIIALVYFVPVLV